MGGAVTAPLLTIAPADRLAAANNRQIVIGFMLTTALGNADTITVTFPVSFVSGTPATATTGILATAAAISGASSNLLVLTATGVVAAATSLSVTVCGLSFTQFLTSMSLPTSAVSVMTNRDYTATCTDSGMIGAATPTVTSVSMMIPFASRKMGMAVAPVFTFTTATNLPAATAGCAATQNSITIMWPASFFGQTPAVGCTAAPSLSATGALITAGYSVSAFTDGKFVFTGTAALTAATFIVTVSGVSLNGAAVVGTDDGIKVSTYMGSTILDAQGKGATGSISGYMVTAAALPTCMSSATSCQSLVITFMSTVTVSAGGTIMIYFADSVGTATMPLMGVSDAFMMGGVLFLPGSISTNVLTLTSASTTGSYTFDGTSVSLTLTGMQIKAASPSGAADYSTIYVSMGSAQGPKSYSGMVSPTGTTTKTTSLTIDKPYPGVTGARATVSFTTSSDLVSGGAVYMSLPVGFFTAFSSVMSCTGVMPSGKFAATTAPMCVTLTASNIATQTPAMGDKFDLITVTLSGTGTLVAGANSFVLSGVNLNAGTVAATTAFKVTTSADICSLGAVTTGSISASNPGGSASSAASAVLCMALLLSSVLIMLL